MNGEDLVELFRVGRVEWKWSLSTGLLRNGVISVDRQQVKDRFYWCRRNLQLTGSDEGLPKG